MRDMIMFLGLAFVPVTITLIALCLAARDRAQRAEAVLREIALQSARGGSGLPRDPNDVYRALDAIAVEVERISEGQRFTAKLLSESRAHRGDGRVITPH